MILCDFFVCTPSRAVNYLTREMVWIVHKGQLLINVKIESK